MASEVLAIKEEYLEEFIEVLERGMNGEMSEKLRGHLERWIEEVKDYLKELNED